MSTPSAVLATGATVRHRRVRFGTAFAVTYLVVLVAGAVLGDALWFVPSYSEKVVVNGEIANRYALGPSRQALFGTDQLGYDVLSKCLYGARTTLLVGIGATVIGLVGGGLIGIVAGYRRGATDRVVGIVTDCLLSLPAIVLAIVMISKLDVVEADQTWLAWVDRRWQLVFTLGLLSIAPFARIVRAQTLTLREREFVLAARCLGAPTTPHAGARDPAQPGADDADGGVHRARHPDGRRGRAGLPRPQRREPDADVGQADRRRTATRWTTAGGRRCSRA